MLPSRCRVDCYTALAWWQLVDSNHVGLTHWTLGNFRHAIFKQISVIDGWRICCEIALIWMPLDFTDDQSTLVQVLAWCRQATSHYLSQCWPRSLLPYGVIRQQWVKSLKASQRSIITALTRLKLTRKVDFDLIHNMMLQDSISTIWCYKIVYQQMLEKILVLVCFLPKSYVLRPCLRKGGTKACFTHFMAYCDVGIICLHIKAIHVDVTSAQMAIYYFV